MRSRTLVLAIGSIALPQVPRQEYSRGPRSNPIPFDGDGGFEGNRTGNREGKGTTTENLEGASQL